MKNIAIIIEGISSTSYLISKNVSTILKNIGYQVEVISIKEKIWRTIYDKIIVDKNDFSIVRDDQKINFDCAYIYGEGMMTKGWIQAYLSLLDIPYIFSSPLSNLLTANKFFCKNYLKSIDVVSPKGIKVKKNAQSYINTFIKNIGFPCIVKPNIGTDSYLVEKVDTLSGLQKAINNIFDAGHEALIEEFIEGREMTCGVIVKGTESIPTLVTEIIAPKGEFYNHDVKLNRRSKKLTPAPLPIQETQQCQDLTLKVYQALECEGCIRIDYVLKKDTFYLLEVNISPGLLDRSNLLLQLETMGENLEIIFRDMIEAKTTISKLLPIK